MSLAIGNKFLDLFFRPVSRSTFHDGFARDQTKSDKQDEYNFFHFYNLKFYGMKLDKMSHQIVIQVILSKQVYFIFEMSDFKIDVL